MHEHAATLLLVGAVAFAAVCGLAWQRVKYDRLEKRAGVLALAVSNDSAARDSTRRLTLAVGTLSDSLQAVQRLAVQTMAARDSLDDALKLERKALTTATATIRSLAVSRGGSRVVTVTPASEPGGSPRYSQRFAVDSTPYHVTADVSLGAPPDSGRIALAVRVDPLTLETRLGCGPANGAGIRAASVTLVGPAWATLTLGRVEQTADVCRSPALEPPGGDGRSWFRKLTDRVGVSAGYGIVSAGGSIHAGPAAIAGVKVWP